MKTTSRIRFSIIKTISVFSAAVLSMTILSGCTVSEPLAYEDLPSFTVIQKPMEHRGDWNFSYLDSDRVEQSMNCEKTSRYRKRTRSTCQSSDGQVKLQFSAKRNRVRSVNLQKNGSDVKLRFVNSDIQDAVKVWVPADS